jgi:hypothetical protein
MQVSQHLMFSLVPMRLPILWHQEKFVDRPSFLFIALFFVDLLLCLLLSWWIDNNDGWGRLSHACCLARVSMFVSRKISHGETSRLLQSIVNCTWILFLSMILIHAFPPSSACLPGGFLSTTTRLWIERS